MSSYSKTLLPKFDLALMLEQEKNNGGSVRVAKLKFLANTFVCIKRKKEVKARAVQYYQISSDQTRESAFIGTVSIENVERTMTNIATIEKIFFIFLFLLFLR
jgi:hypothetical protein